MDPYNRKSTLRSLGFQPGILLGGKCRGGLYSAEVPPVFHRGTVGQKKLGLTGFSSASGRNGTDEEHFTATDFRHPKKNRRVFHRQ